MRAKPIATAVFVWIGVAVALLISAFYTCGGTQCVLGEVDGPQLETWLKTFLPKIATLVILFFVFMIAGKIWIDVFYKRAYLKKHTETEFYGHAKLIRFAWWIVYTLLAFGLFFRNVGALLTSLGLIGFGITFALQKPILNFVGWMNIVTTRPYSVGDRIKIDNVRGDVIDIQVMNTVLIGLLETSDSRSDKVVTIPNELILTSAVENYTKNSNFLVNELTVTITYESDYHTAIDLLLRIVEEQTQQNIHLFRQRLSTRRIEIEKRINRLTRRFLQTSEDDKNLQGDIKLLEKERKGLDLLLGEVREQFQPKVNIELQDSSIALVCQYYCPYDANKKTRTQVYLRFMDEIAKHKNISIAYPTTREIIETANNSNEAKEIFEENKKVKLK